ncbi:hypothetical protein AB0H10_38755, partial [Streptomyces longwoodensis]
MSALFTGRYRELLLDLLRLPSVNPLETGSADPPSRLPELLERYAAAAASAERSGEIVTPGGNHRPGFRRLKGRTG